MRCNMISEMIRLSTQFQPNEHQPEFKDGRTAARGKRELEANRKEH
jgi:hypothetical protein